ncbi:MAG: 2-hydroxychromene-2-carboxylate isomerase [Hydrogenophilaceae bacterium]|nr:2-hydroxychromene-2-carboxylate isomerase [Hydrogenophilaceae bacterium]
MVKTVEFLFDFGSPNAYLAHRVIPAIEARAGAKFIYKPVLLGGLFKLTGNQAPMVAFAGIPNKLAYEMLELRRFVAAHKLTRFAMNPHFPVNTLMLMRGAVAAEIDGVLAPYVEAGFTAMWEEGLRMDDPAVWRETFAAAGLDADRLLARTKDDDVKSKLLAATEAAAARGAFGIPSFFVGDDLYFGKDRLRDVEEALAGVA